ncbi:hypothetical protein EVB27_078 [Rhizobium phage RHph_TM16]|nr:hypothetical protein EVB27_078 [Rhizobium phage RHph_TM16]
MVEYRYRRTAFTKGGKTIVEDVALSSEELSRYAEEPPSELALLRLLNRWNKHGLIGVSSGGPIYVFTADREGQVNMIMDKGEA